MIVTGSVRLDISAAAEGEIRSIVGRAIPAVPSVRIVLVVGKQWVDYEAVRLLRDFADQASVDVQGDPGAVGQWVRALRGSEAT